MFKTEATLGLVGAILGAVACLLAIIIVLVVGLLLNTAASAYDDAMAEFDEAFEGFDDYDMEVSTAVSTAAGAAVGVVIIGIVLSIASVVLGFIGSAKLRKDDKKGGILLIVAGGLSLVSLFTAGFYGIATMVLFLIGGIMALAKKAPVAAA